MKINSKGALASYDGEIGPATTAQPQQPAQPQQAAPLDWYGQQMKAFVPQVRASVASLPGALQAARQADETYYADRSAALNEEMNDLREPVQSDTMLALAAGLMAPTQTGSFGESLGKAVTNASATRAEARRAQEAKNEKLYRTRLALAELQRAQDQAPLLRINDQLGMIDTLGRANSATADYELGYGPTPTGDAALVEDARRFPNKYAGPRGQAMIADAQARISATAKTADERAWWTQQQEIQSRLRQQEDRNRFALEGNKPTPLDRAEANRVAKRLAETQTSASEASKLRGDIAALRAARANTGYEGGLGADTFATVGGWLGIDSAENMQTIRAQAENLRLGLTNQLKGAISDKDMQLLGNATAGLGMTDDAAEPLLQAQEAGAQRAIERSQFLQRWVQLNGNDYGADEAWSIYTEQNPLFSQAKDGKLALNKMNVGNWRDYLPSPGGRPANSGQGQSSQQQGATGAQPQAGASPLFDVNSLPPNVQAWAERQLQNGIPPEQVIRHLNEKILQQQGGAN